MNFEPAGQGMTPVRLQSEPLVDPRSSAEHPEGNAGLQEWAKSRGTRGDSSPSLSMRRPEARDPIEAATPVAQEPPANDEDLIQRIQQGDEEALRLWCERHARRLLNRIGRQLPDEVRQKVAESDIFQEAFIVALQRLKDFEDRGEGSFGRWLARIMDFKVREEVRRYMDATKRGVRREVPLDDQRREVQYLPAQTPTPSETAMGEDLRAAALRAMEALAPDYRQVLHFLQEQGLTLDQAAARMGRTKNAVKKLYGRALTQYAKLLDVDRRTKP